MPTTGRALVSTIQGMVDVDTRKKRYELASRMAEHTQRLAENLGADEDVRAKLIRRADEMFDAFRGADMMAGRMREAMSSIDLSAKYSPAELAFEQVLARWGDFDNEVVHKIYRKSVDFYQELKAELFASRSQAAHVSAVLRPFQRKYFEIWQQVQLNGLDFETEARNIHALGEQRISTSLDLSIWARASYDLFYKLAVLKPVVDLTKSDHAAVAATKPLGAIRASSERTYRQQWFAWIKKNDQRIIDQLEGAQETFANSSVFETSYMSTVSAPAPSLGTFESVQVPVAAAAAVTPAAVAPVVAAISIKLVNLEDQSLFADRTWNKAADAVLQVGPWVATLERIWGKSAQQVLTTLEIELPDGATKLNLPQQGLGTLAQVIKDAINSLT